MKKIIINKSNQDKTVLLLENENIVEEIKEECAPSQEELAVSWQTHHLQTHTKVIVEYRAADAQTIHRMKAAYLSSASRLRKLGACALICIDLK